MPEPGRIHRSSTRVMSSVMIVIGIALLVRTIALGGGPISTGILLGAAFLLVGTARLYMQWRSP